MENLLLYLFSAIAFVSALFIAFYEKSESRSGGIYVFIFSTAGLLSLFNAGYLSFIIIASAAIIFSFTIIKGFHINSTIEEFSSPLNSLHLMAVSLIGSLIAAQAGATIWPGDVVLKREISLVNFGGLISGEYFVLFVITFSAAFIIFNRNDENVKN